MPALWGPWQNEWAFVTEGDIGQPSQTPAFADAVHYWVWPREIDLAASNLETGGTSLILDWVPGMAALTVPRHGSRPNRIPTNHRPEEVLPGAINVAFFDGHAEQVKLARLWQLQWHRDYHPPPGPRGSW